MVKFEFLGRLRGKDKDDEDEGVPVDEVKELSDQGYSQHEITEELRDRGYGYAEINQAMNRAVRESATGDGPDQTSGPQAQDQTYPEVPGGGQQPPQRDDQSMPRQDRSDQGQYQYGSQPQQGGGQYQQQTQQRGGDWSSDVGISGDEEALIETIVEEKLIDLEDEFQSLYNIINDLQERVNTLEKQVRELNTKKEEDEKEFIQRVQEIEEYLESSQSRIGGLEKAFQQTLPSLVENVRDLTDLVRDMKDEE